MSEFPFHVTRFGSPANGSKQVAFDHKCQVIPEGDCAKLRKLLSLCPTRAQSPPISGSSARPANLIARAISPQLIRSKSPQLAKKVSGLGSAPPINTSTSTSWRTRLASWGSNTDTSNRVSSVSAAAAAGPSSQHGHAGPHLVAPIAARGTASPMIPSNSDEDDSVEVSPSNESVDFDDFHTEFQNAAFKVAMNQHHLQVESLRAASPALLPSRTPSPFVPRSNFTDLHNQRPNPCNRPKSCLVVRSKTPQAPGPPPLTGDGMTSLRATRSNDRDVCIMRRRRAQGVPVICPSPLSSPENERGPSGWGPDTYGPNHAPKSHKPAAAAPSGKQSKLSRWRRFRRAASEEAHHVKTSSSRSSSIDPRMDEAAIKREIQAGRWPFEAPLNVECSCKNCQAKIEVGLSSDYEPKWTRAARIRWLEAQEDLAAQSRSESSSAASGLPRSTSRTAIQADEVAQLHNETVHPMTAAELAAEPTSPISEQGEAELGSTAEVIAAAAVTTKPPNPTRLEEGDNTLRREILARRQRMARQSPVLRQGARSMMRQIEEAERREKEAAQQRSQCRDSHLSCGSVHGNGLGSGRSSPASPAMSPSQPSTPESVSTSTTPQERQAADGQAANASYFALAAAPPERLRSPLIPSDVAGRPRYARPVATVATDSTTLSMGSVASALEALASPTASPASSSPSGSPAWARR